MKSTYAIDKAFRHLLSVFVFILMMLLNIFEYFNTSDNMTYRIMLGVIFLISLLSCYITGKALKKSKISYK